jgi:hypothetical protein
MQSILDTEDFDKLMRFSNNFGAVVEKEINIMFKEKAT